MKKQKIFGSKVEVAVTPYSGQVSGVAKAKDSLVPHDSFCFWKMASAASTERADGRNDPATASHGHTGTACTSCTNCRTCDCPCNVCTHARRYAAGLICKDCGKDCGFEQCIECEDAMEDELARMRDEPPVCYDCGQEWCTGSVFCPANCHDDCSTDSEMEEMMREEREEEDRHFRAQIARRSAAAAITANAGAGGGSSSK